MGIVTIKLPEGVETPAISIDTIQARIITMVQRITDAYDGATREGNEIKITLKNESRVEEYLRIVGEIQSKVLEELGFDIEEPDFDIS
ncbi:hypothetical protein HOE67_04220 [Candidatus Peregrinibacteria bacterium]|jgi:hypothetical protein|nr:hypothetical protein [Candidatus Peregrinibacteria bacterium]MBT4056289.1 hypothetical protein [Candidatus Peregrinibacteria bacterium]